MEEAASVESAGARVAQARPRARATLLLGLLASALSLVNWTSVGRDSFVIDRRAFWGEPWRFLAAPLAHEHVVQLLVSLVGMWFCARPVEGRLGTGRMLGLCGLLALQTGFAEQAFDHGGSGLTGILFGLWALLVTGGIRHPALRGAVPLVLSLLMAAGFLLSCFVALPVSGWAQGSGVLLGALAGACLDERGELRQPFAPLAIVLLVTLAGGATHWRTSWNFGGAAVEYHRAGLAALERDDEQTAEQEFRTGLAFDERDGEAWWDLGALLARQGRPEEAAEACWRAYENSALDPEQRAYLEEVQRWSLGQHLGLGEPSKSFPYALHLSRLAPDDLEIWEIVRELAFDLDQDDWYDLAQRECARLSPEPK